MHILRGLLMVFCFIPLTGSGQVTHYILNGLIHVKSGETYPYLLFFNIKGSMLTGYSLTKLPDGSEPRVVVEGQVEKEKRIISLTEKKLISDLPENLSMCLVETVLTYNTKKVRYPLAGNFISKDNNAKFCGEGTLEFETSKVLDDLLGVIPADPKPVVKQEAYQPQAGEFEITTGITRQFEWTADTCILEIYDGGLVDGDEVTVLMNDQEVLTNFVLTKQKKRIALPVHKKLNTLTIVAGFEGRVPPNTANLILTDGDKKYKVRAFNRAGERATVIIDRE